MSQDESENKLLWIDTDTTGRARKNSQLARSHAAKVTHRRKQEALAGSASESSPSSSKRAGRAAVQPTTNISKESVSPEDHLKQDYSSTPSISISPATSAFSPFSPQSLPLRNPSPLLGALPNSTFHLAARQDPSDPVQYCIKVIWPRYFWFNEFARSWLATYCDQPLYFHYLHYLTALHHGLIHHRINETSHKQALLYHRGEIIRILKDDVLSQQPLVGSDLEVAVNYVTSLAILDFQQWSEEVLFPIPFVPYMQSAEWLDVFGRLTPVESHMRAVDMLVEQAGGLESFRSNGMRTKIATNDLFYASINLTHPTKPNVWEVQTVMKDTGLEYDGAHAFSTIPGGLPHRLLAVLTDLNIIDRIMNAYADSPLNHEEHSTILRQRNTIHHRLLSIPTWKELTELEREGSYLATYECVRLTAILYSQSIIFPLPPDSGWHLRLLRKLEEILQTSNPENWTLDVSQLLTWVLVMGGITAYRTAYRIFFVRSLKMVLARGGEEMKSWSKVQNVLCGFLWSERACNRGAAVLWEDLTNGGERRAVRPTDQMVRRSTS